MHSAQHCVLRATEPDFYEWLRSLHFILCILGHNSDEKAVSFDLQGRGSWVR